MPISQNINYDGYKSYDSVRTKVCAYCKKSYKLASCEMEYKQKLGNKIYNYCSYKCRSNHRKQYEEEQYNIEQASNRGYSKNTKELLIELNNKGLTYFEISLELKINPTRVASLFRKYGIKKNTRYNYKKND